MLTEPQVSLSTFCPHLQGDASAMAERCAGARPAHPFPPPPGFLGKGTDMREPGGVQTCPMSLFFLSMVGVAGTWILVALCRCSAINSLLFLAYLKYGKKSLQK